MRTKAEISKSTKAAAKAKTAAASDRPVVKKDAVTFLKTQHNQVKALFRQCDRLFAKDVDSVSGELADLCRQICQMLAIHAQIEEQIFYPACRERLGEDSDIVLESLEEHSVVKFLVSELNLMEPQDERFEARLTVLKEMVDHHVQEEETQLFPQIKKLLSRKQLLEIGGMLAEAAELVPPKASVGAPDTPPGNLTPKTQPLYERAIELVSQED